MASLSAWISGDSRLSTPEKKTREIVLYFVFGGLTTLVNLISFIGFDKLFGMYEVPLTIAGLRFDLLDALNTTIAWILAVLFAFVTNRAFVFCSKGPFFREMIGFFSSRILTLIVFEIGFLQLGILIVEQVLLQSKDTSIFAIGTFTVTYLYMVKIAIAVFVVIGNYILSKLFVFRQKKSIPTATNDAESDAGKET